MENKTSKYFKYAIGEIILVVIGILIALQINNWNENSKNKEVEQLYLEGIRNNLNQDIYDLNKLIEKDTLKLHHYTNLLKPFTDKTINKYSREFIYILGQSYTTHTFNGNNIVFEDMKSSGKINYIKSDILRFSLLEYYNESQRIIKYQNGGYLTEFNILKREAFIDNTDLNSLIENFMFKKNLSASVDKLDMSFFDADINSDKVKKFVNRISVMKVLIQKNYFNNQDLIFKANRLRNKINQYLSAQSLDDNNYISKEIISAIKEGNIPFLKQNISPNIINNCFETEFEKSSYLAIAIYEESLASVKYFLDLDADINQVCQNKTPLMYASKFGLLDITKYLIEKGADINFVSIKGKTALDYAIQYEKPEIITFLKKLKAKQVMTLKND
jgi:hypothetical protein